MTTSALSMSPRTASISAGSLKFACTMVRPRSCARIGPLADPSPGRCTRTTSAPRSASIIPACGPGPMLASSTIRTPANGPFDALMRNPFDLPPRPQK